MTAKQRAEKAVAILKEKYPDAECSLKYEGEPWKLIIMAILSAQCTDARVNIVCEGLFKRFPGIYELSLASVPEIEEYIKSCGLYHAKAKNIKACCEMLTDKFGGEIPSDMDELLLLPGVGRKIANLMLGDVFGKPAIVTDTHCIRISEKIGLTEEGEKNPLRTEKALLKLIPPEESADFCHRLVLFGREVCTARNPACGLCPLKPYCRYGEKL